MYQDRIVLFLDILGFKKHVLETIETSGDEHIELASRVKNLSDCLLEMGEIAQVGNMVYDTMVTQFSDSIVLSFVGDDTNALSLTIDLVHQIIVRLVESKIVCRGALSFGKLVHTEKLLFGPALIDAYETESKAAMYPRVVMDKNIYNLAGFQKGNKSLYDNLSQDLDYKIQMDLDGKYYLDYFKAPMYSDLSDIKLVDYYKSLRNIIIQGSKFQQPDLKVKYGWMRVKYNQLIEQLNDKPDSFEISDNVFNNYFIGLNTLKY